MADKEDIKADDMPEKDDVKKAEKKPTPKKKTSDKEEVLVKNTIEINPKLEEAVGGTVVLGWGRMNPITTGHEKLMKKIDDVARKSGGTPQVYLTHSSDAKKNPLSYNDKIMLARKAFGKAIVKSNSKTIIQVMQELQKKFKDVILIVGADRTKEMDTLLNKYNGKEYNFDSIKVVSAGNRVDPDSEQAKEMTADSMSASVMRKLASEGDFETFKKGLPKKLQSNAQGVYDMVRAGMKLAEELESQGLLDEAILNFQQRRQRGITMRKYKSKIAMGRKRSMRKAATKEKLQSRARKKAISIIRQKVAGDKGKGYSELSASEKMLIDKKVAKRKAVIDRIAKKMLPKLRKADRSRLSGGSGRINEDFELFMEASTNDTTPKKRYHEARKKDGSIKLDKRFRAFKKPKTAIEEKTDEVARVKATHKREREEMSREHERELDGAQSRALRSTIRKINKNEETSIQEFADDKQLLAFIEEVSNDIANSVELEESKIEKSLTEKAEKHGVEFEDIRDIYEYALDEGKTIEEAFMSVNVYLANLKEESNYKVSVEGLPDFFVKADTANEVKLKIRKMLKKPNDVTDVERVTDSTMKKHFRLRYQGKDDEAEAELDEQFLYMELDEDFAKDWKELNTPQLIKKLKSVTVSKKRYEYAKKLVQQIYDRKKAEGGPKGPKHGIGYYASNIARQVPGVDAKILARSLGEEHGAGDRGTEKVTKRYKKDTPGENINEAFEELFEEVTQKQIQDLEKFADRLLDKFGVDVEFTRHFADRMNDDRNNPAISIAELQKFFKKIAKNKAKDIKANGDSEAVLNDIQADLNLPVVIKYDRNKEEFEVVNKTIMRKKNFKTPNKVIKY